MKQEQWIDGVLQSLQGIQRVEANPYLHTKVLARLDDGRPVPLRLVWTAAAAFAAVLVLNLSVWLSPVPQAPVRAATAGIETVVEEYGLTYTDMGETISK